MNLDKMFAQQSFAAHYARTAERLTGPGAVQLLRFSGLSSLSSPANDDGDSQRPVKVYDCATGTALIPSYLFSPPADLSDLKTSLPAGQLLVTGGDLSDEMVGFANQRAQAAGWPSGAFEARKIDALDSKLPDDEFDYVTCCFGIQSMPDILKALQECHRVARPGGKLAVNAWAKVFWLDLIHEAGRKSGIFEVPPFAWKVEEKGQEGPLVDALKEAGWQSIKTDRLEWDIEFDGADELLDGLAPMLPTIAAVDAQNKDKLDQIREAVTKTVHDKYGRGAFTLPGCVVVAVGTKSS